MKKYRHDDRPNAVLLCNDNFEISVRFKKDS